MPDGFELPPGHAVLTTYGSVTAETLASYAETRVACVLQGVKNIAWPIFPGALVDKVRNEAVANLLRDPNANWLLFMDADMQWQPDAFMMLLQTAYSDLTWADIVGAWCPLRGFPYLPTIDPGSGTWEPISPGCGPIEVMRTGAAFVLVKRHVFEKLEAPWYGIRPVPRPIDVMTEFDNYCNQKFDGKNPFSKMKEWEQVLGCAADDSNSPRDPQLPFHTVGEDSGLADRAKAAGFRIVVQTNAVINHIDKKVITAEDHLDAFRELREAEAAALGVLG